MRFASVAFILLLLPLFLTAQPGTPYAPPDGLVTEIINQTLRWNADAQALNYHVEVDTLAGFPSPILQTTTSVDSLPFTGTANQTYYWRVITQYSGSEDTSRTYRFTVVDLAQFSGLELWLRSDSGVTVDGSNRISQWEDQGPAGHVISQGNANLRPNYVTSPGSFTKPVARFDGSNDLFNTSIPLNSVFHVYVVSKYDPTGNVLQAILGTNGVSSIPSGAFSFFYVGGSAIFRTNGTTDAVASITAGEYDLIRVLSATSGVVQAAANEDALHTQSNANTNFNNTGITIAGPNPSGRILKGDIAEILYFKTAQTDSIGTLVRKYLYHKYNPPLSLGPDVNIPQGYCATTLQGPSYFTTYQWSNGSTSVSMQVSRSGTYWLEATDLFGNVYTDTIEVTYLEQPEAFGDTTICAGEALPLKLDNLPGPYQVTWSDGTLGDSIAITTTGDYWYQVEDNGNCVFQSDTFTVTVDPFPLLDFFPEDTTLCEGNKLVVTGITGLTPTWSTGSQDTAITVTQSGTYWVYADNANGCRATDTVDVVIKGLAPIAHFATDSTCVGHDAQFTDSSSTQDQSTLVQWQWDFGDGGSSNQQDPVHTYTADGSYPVTLTVTTDSGCSAVAIQEAHVVAAPSVSIASAPLDSSCLGAVVSFNGITNVTPDNPVTNWDWDFGDGNQSALAQPTHLYGSIGTYAVTLEITTEFGCTADTQTSYRVLDPATVGIPVLDPYFPADDFLITDTSITFRWNRDDLFYAYRLEIDSDTGFQPLVVAKDNIQTDSVTVSLGSITKTDTLYWRVIGYSVCNDTIVSTTRQLVRFTPGVLTGLSMWLRAENGVQTDGNGKVSQWEDVRGNGLMAAQGDGNLRPTLESTPGSINSSYSVRFDGNNDLMPMTLSIDSVNSLIILFRENAGGNSLQALLGSRGVSSIQAGHFSLFSSVSSRAIFRTNGTVDSHVPISPLDYNILQADISPNTVVLWNNNDQFGSNGNHTTGFIRDNMVLAGPDNSGRILKGDVLEVMAFQNIVTGPEREQLYRYFQYKYAPPVNIGPDIHIAYGFCDTTLHAERHWLRKYEWNTGDTSATLTINKPGLYHVTATDPFGFTSTDTMELTHPVFFPEAYTKICLGDTFTWDTRLSTSEYTISWPDGSGNSSFDITEEGFYWVTIQDQNGCSITDTIFVDVDSFEVQATLGPDASLCSGNKIGLAAGANEAVSYQWSTGDNTPTTTVQNAGAYWVEVANVNGCIARDTMDVQIIGTVPTPDFTATALCLGQSAQFTDQSQAAPGDVLNQWEWAFGDDSTSTIQNPQHTYADSGAYDITLTVSTTDGCVHSATKTLFVNPLPDLDFTTAPQDPCQFESIQFADFSTVYNGFMTQWHWDFGNGDTSIQENPVYMYNTPLIYDVRLIGTSNHGCRDTIVKSLLVVGSPIANFAHGPACSGRLTQFTDISDQGQSSPINSWTWDFGDGTNSNNRNPAHIFNDPGTYDVNFRVRSTNTCTTDTTIQVTVSQTPVAFFAPDSACVGTPVPFTDETDTFNVGITNWRWEFGDGGSDTLPNPVHTYTDVGTYGVKLVVEDGVGCIDSVIGPVNIATNPTAAFTFNPTFGAAPIDVTFQATSPGANDFEWYVADSLGNETFAGTSSSPVYTFTENGVYQVTQIVTNPSGCRDTLVRSMFIAVPILDLWVDHVVLVQDILPDGTYKVNMAARVRNKGSRVVSSFDLYATLGAGSTVVEGWEGTMNPGDAILHQFQSAFFVADASNNPFICIEAKNINGNEVDDFPADNILCEPIEDIIKVLDPYPSPAHSSVTVDVVIPRAEQLTVRIFNALGQEVRTVHDSPGTRGLNRFLVPLSDLPNGTFFVRVRYRDEVYVKAFVVGR